MTLDRPKAVLFDLDGTLVDTLTGLTQQVNLMRRDFDKRPLPAEQVALYIGKGIRILIHRSMTESMDGRLSEDMFNLAALSLNKHVKAGRFDYGSLYPDVKSSLERLRAQGVLIGLVTNKMESLTLVTLEKLGVRDLFDVVVGGDTAEQPKPSAAPILLACERLGVSPEQAVMVGDSGNDSASAKAAGVASILVRTGWSEGISLEEIALRDNSVAIVDNIEQATNLLLA